VSEETDEALMVAHVKGDTSAFPILFQRYASTVRGIMRRDIRKTQDADELVQETFLNLHRAARDFQPDRRLRPWLMTIAFNLKREYFRRKGRRPEAPLDLDGRNDPSVEPRILERRHAAQQVSRALASLTDSQRQVIEMHWFAGLSFPEISTAVGASLSAVKVRAHRGYERMRALLPEEKV
jgi:RNA polymerase sigma factor (sigma-70 family)